MPASFAASLKPLAADIKLSHSVFALPFAVLGALIARAPGPFTPRDALLLALVVACMVAARTWAMLVNRLADAEIDAHNPRTARRVLARGGVPRAHAAALAAAAALLFIALAAGFFAVAHNPWPLALSVPVLAWIAAYSWTKRFTSLCHLWLGVSLALSPVAAALAVDPAAVGLDGWGGGTLRPAVFWLSGMVAAWVAGFDVIYALQDEAFDRARGLRSIPAALGTRGALWISRALHAAAAVLCFAASRADERFGPVFTAAAVLVAALLLLEHALIARLGPRAIPAAFLTVNGVVSLAAGALGAVDLMIPA
ncbi:MAG: UbiA family prenyltransferase [Phycisphaeraceae bacterium]|nr:MAG: UbiA family prenyltransferase [Phycisphaeraceae bacterium]